MAGYDDRARRRRARDPHIEILSLSLAVTLLACGGGGDDTTGEVPERDVPGGPDGSRGTETPAPTELPCADAPFIGAWWVVEPDDTAMNHRSGEYTFEANCRASYATRRRERPVMEEFEWRWEGATFEAELSVAPAPGEADMRLALSGVVNSDGESIAVERRWLLAGEDVVAPLLRDARLAPGPWEETCGNGRLSFGDACDPDPEGDWTVTQTRRACHTLGFGLGSAACLEDCSGWDTSVCHPPMCGDGLISDNEVCDTRHWQCSNFGYLYGWAVCSDDCTRFDLSNCHDDASDTCGNRVRDGGEVCDYNPSPMSWKLCTELGFLGGRYFHPVSRSMEFSEEHRVPCRVDCSGWDTSSCEGVACGNGVLDSGEVCDAAGPPRPCREFGDRFVGTSVAPCLDDCSGYDTSGCAPNPGPHCGDGSVDSPDEACDPPGSTRACADIDAQWTTGTALCDYACQWDTRGWPHRPDGCSRCGDGIRQEGEVCEIGDTLDCSEIGPRYVGGPATCNSTCGGWDISACTLLWYCGDGDTDPDEECDAGNREYFEPVTTCQALGFSNIGLVPCTQNCRWDTSNCNMQSPAACGDGVVNGGETCELGDTIACSAFGLTGGSARCRDDCRGWVIDDCQLGGGGGEEPAPGTCTDRSPCVHIDVIEHGENCGRPESVRTRIRNVCQEAINACYCLERSNGSWACGCDGQLHPGETTGQFVCEGTGEVVYRATTPEQNVYQCFPGWPG